MMQALQASHSGLEASAGLSHVPGGQHAPHALHVQAVPHVPVGQHTSHGLRPELGLPAEAEIRPLLEIDNPGMISGITLPQAERAAASGMQVPSGPLHNSQPITDMPLRPAAQLS